MKGAKNSHEAGWFELFFCFELQSLFCQIRNHISLISLLSGYKPVSLPHRGKAGWLHVRARPALTDDSDNVEYIEAISIIQQFIRKTHQFSLISDTTTGLTELVHRILFGCRLQSVLRRRNQYTVGSRDRNSNYYTKNKDIKMSALSFQSYLICR